MGNDYKEIKDIFKNINFTHVSVFLSFNAIINQYLYYREFNIYIFDFISINDLIPFVFIIIPKTIFFIVVVAGIIFSFHKIYMILKKIKWPYWIRRMKKSLSSKENNSDQVVTNSFLLFKILVLLYVYLGIIFREFIPLTNPKGSISVSEFIISFILALSFLADAEKLNIKKKLTEYINITIFIYIISLTTAYFAFWESIIVKNFPVKDQVEFTYLKDEIKVNVITGIDKEYYYVGMTADFMLLYNQNLERSLILKSENIDSLRFYTEKRKIHHGGMPLPRKK